MSVRENKKAKRKKCRRRIRHTYLVIIGISFDYTCVYAVLGIVHDTENKIKSCMCYKRHFTITNANPYAMQYIKLLYKVAYTFDFIHTQSVRIT